MEHRRNLEMQFAGMMGQNIENAKLASFSQVISGLPQLRRDTRADAAGVRHPGQVGLGVGDLNGRTVHIPA